MDEPEKIKASKKTPRQFNLGVIITALIMAALLLTYVAFDKQKTIESLREEKLTLLNTIDSLHMQIQGKDIILRKLDVKENVDSSLDGINILKENHYFYYNTAIPQSVWEAAKSFEAEKDKLDHPTNL
jgi:hypothetical protein